VSALRDELDAPVIALFDRMLRHASSDVKSPLLRDVPDDPRLLGGMFFVLGQRWGWQEATARAWLATYAGTDAYEEARSHVGVAAALADDEDDDEDDGDDDGDDEEEDDEDEEQEDDEDVN
jgi:hypothetical protein